MSVLILHLRGSLRSTPYDSWLSDYDGDLILLASREHLDMIGEDLPSGQTGYRYMEAVRGYQFNGRLEARALELAREFDVEYVIAPQEQDLERAAQLREILDLPGQRLTSVLPFRDKIRMKDAARAAGVPVAEYRDVECAIDIIDFAERNGFPVVVKPRDGGGSFGVRILRSRAELDEFLDEGIDFHGYGQSNLMVESFVSDSMCHVDGLVVDGEVVYAWPSRYLYALAVFENDLGGRLDVTLDADDPLTPRLLDLTDEIIGALPAPRDFAFHAEIFHTPDGRLVLGEIACRTGGAEQVNIQRTMFGVNPTECWIRAQIGLPLPFDSGRGRMRPATLTGQLVLLKRPGKILDLPGEPPFEWVVKHKVTVERGQSMAAAAFAADFMATFVISAPDRETSVSRMRTLEEWFLSGLSLGPVTETHPLSGGTADLTGVTEGTGNAR